MLFNCRFIQVLVVEYKVAVLEEGWIQTSNLRSSYMKLRFHQRSKFHSILIRDTHVDTLIRNKAHRNNNNNSIVSRCHRHQHCGFAVAYSSRPFDTNFCTHRFNPGKPIPQLNTTFRDLDIDYLLFIWIVWIYSSLLIINHSHLKVLRIYVGSACFDWSFASVYLRGIMQSSV